MLSALRTPDKEEEEENEEEREMERGRGRGKTSSPTLSSSSSAGGSDQSEETSALISETTSALVVPAPAPAPVPVVREEPRAFAREIEETEARDAKKKSFAPLAVARTDMGVSPVRPRLLSERPPTSSGPRVPPRAEEQEQEQEQAAQGSLAPVTTSDSDRERNEEETRELVLFKGDQLRTAVQYRSSDPIQNLRVRVKVRQVRGPTAIESSSTGASFRPLASGSMTTATPTAPHNKKNHNDNNNASELETEGGTSGSSSWSQHEDEPEMDSDEETHDDEKKWFAQDLAWQQKIYDRGTLDAARESGQALEKHLRRLFGMPKARHTHPSKEQKFQEVCRRYQEEIMETRTAKIAPKQSGAEIYTYVDYEDSVRQVIADDTGEVAEDSITTSSEGSSSSRSHLSCGLRNRKGNVKSNHNGGKAKGSGFRSSKREKENKNNGKKYGQEPFSHRNQKTREKTAQSMTIVVGMNGEQIILAQVRLFQSGILEMRPGFSDSSSNNGKSSVFFAETPNGSLLEYTLENGSAPIKSETMKSMFGGLGLSHREKKKTPAINPAMTVRKAGLGGPFLSLQDRFGPNRTMSSFNLLLEIVAGKNFRRDNLYVEYYVHFPREKVDPFEAQTPAYKTSSIEDIWKVADSTKKYAQGVTQISSFKKFPTTSYAESGREKDRLVNWCFPVELEMTALRDASELEESEWPTMVFTVFSYDAWHRSTCEGFGKLKLSAECLGTKCHYLNMWKPFGSLKQRMQESFTGGIIQPQDLHGLYDFLISGKLDSPMVTETTGVLKVRTNMILQKQVDNMRLSKSLSRSLVFTPVKPKTPVKGGFKPKQPKSTGTKMQSHTLAEITERARERIRVLREKNAKANQAQSVQLS